MCLLSLFHIVKNERLNTYDDLFLVPLHRYLHSSFSAKGVFFHKYKIFIIIIISVDIINQIHMLRQLFYEIK